MAIPRTPPPGGATASLGPSLDPADFTARTALLVLDRPVSLDMHGGVATKRVTNDTPDGWIEQAQERRRAIIAAGCLRWPKSLRLVSTGGHFVPGRCRGTRLCDYCGILGGNEWSEMLALDAVEHGAPTMYVCLTTSRVGWSPREASRARELLVRAIRAEWPGAEYACLVEFTTGYAATSGGRRRPHWNLLWKGVPDGSEARLRELISLYWCGPARAKLVGQKVSPVWAAEGLIRYLGLHFLKESQKPPRSWTGHRVTASSGYFGAGRRGAREQAQAALRLKRQIWRAEQEGLEGVEALALAELRIIRAAQLRWECVELTVDLTTGEVLRGRPIHGRDTVLRPARRRPVTLTLDEEVELASMRLPGYVEVPA